MSKKVSRGIRNNNPGNIRKSKDKWQGLADNQTDSEFFTFKDPTYGIRAMARLLINYQDKYNLTTVQRIINRWAPPQGDRNGSAPGGEYTQDTSAYARAVATHMGVGVRETINLHDFQHLYPLVEAMIKHENGVQPYTEAQITKGLVLAGVEPERKSLTKSKTIAAGTIASGAATVSVVEQISEVADVVDKGYPAISLVGTLAEYAPIVLGILTIALIGYIIYDRIEDRKKGLR